MVMVMGRLIPPPPPKQVGAVGDSAADANEGKEEDGDETDDQRKIEPRQFRKDARLVFWR